MRHGQQMRRDVLFELQLGLERGFGAARKPDAGRHAEDVGIDGHHLLAPDDRPYDVGRLAPHAGQPLQGVEIRRHHAAELRAEHPRHGGQVPGLVVGIGDAFDVGVDLFDRSLRHRLGRRIGFEKRRRSHVDPLVGTLRRKNDGHQQLVGILVLQLALG